MIVACSACSTRFRVADEKVGPRGARIRCSRCGQTFLAPPPALPEPPPAEPAHVAPEPTGTGGWPTGVLEVAGAASSDSGSSIGLALETDPFAAYASQSAPVPPLVSPAAPAPEPSGDLGSLPVTDLSALERTGALSIDAPLPPEQALAVEDGLSLEDRTPTATSLRESAARWGDPDASQAIEVGPDGFQEVDLASGAERPDPEFDARADEQTAEVPVPRAPVARPAPQEVAPEGTLPAKAEPGPAVPEVTAGSTSAAHQKPARARALAMNVLSLAALLLVTLGIVLWWRGDGIGAVLRWPRAGHADLDVGGIASGVYEGSHGQSVIFVRGVVRATHEPVEGPVTVRVVLERGGAPLGAVTANAGAVPSAEELAEVTSPEGLAALRQQVDSRAPLRIVPGSDLPFLAVLPLPDGDVGAIHFRIETLPARGR